MKSRTTEDSNNLETGSESLSKAKAAAFRLLSYRKRSKSELIERLQRKEFGKDDIDGTISYLEELNYLDDKDFALSFVIDKVKNKNLGPIAIKNEIKKYNIDPDIIEESMKAVYKDFPVNEIIPRLIKTRLAKNSSSIIDDKVKVQIINLLKRKGFYWEDIEKFGRIYKIIL